MVTYIEGPNSYL